MTAAYFLRLFLLSLASFFLVNLAAGLVISGASAGILRLSERLSPATAARVLLVLRLFPAFFALFFVAAFCIPSYLWLEPDVAAETAGLGCIAAAILGVMICGLAIGRTVRAALRSARYFDQCSTAASEARLEGEAAPVWVLEKAAPVVALSGIVHPRVVISRGILEALAPDQLAMALRHEDAHRASRDNLKRLLILLAPGAFPFFRGFGRLERGWAKFTEWAADDRASAGDARCSLSLAAALVRVARLSAPAPPGLLSNALIGEDENLPARIHRLLHPRPQRPRISRWIPIATLCLPLLLAGGLARLLAEPAVLASVHGLLETFMH